MPANPPPLFDHYELEQMASGGLRVLSSDGTGTTHRATDTRTQQPVIIRIFSERLLADAATQRDFVEHAQLLIELDHPNITRIIDTGQFGNQFFYVVQDPRGKTVEELVEASGPLDVGWALRLHLQLFEALMAVRTKPGLLSRVWPRNLMITSEGESSRINLIAQNLIAPVHPVEQPEFLAPEILAGHADSAQATLYSIGATLYYMLTAKSPYPAGLSVEDLIELKSSSLPDMSVLPPAAPTTLLRQILESDSRNRPKSLMEWDRALQRFIRFTPQDTGRIMVPGEPVSALPPPVAAKPVTPFVVVPAPPKSPEPEPQPSDLELEKAKVHTQRLRLELTKRVQKELALTAQLKELEEKLEAERDRVQELTARQTITPTEEEQKRIESNKAKVDDEWESLRAAKKKLDREQNEFLKKTQRFSVSQLKSELDEAKVPKSDDAKVGQAKPRSFWFSRRPKEKEALVEKVPVQPQAPVAKTEPSVQPQAQKKEVLADSPKVESLKASSPVKPTTSDTPFSISKPAADTAAPSKQSEPKVVTFVRPSEAEKPAIAAKEAEVPVSPSDGDHSKKGVPRIPRADRAIVSKPVIHRATPASRIPTPTYQPLPGAWLALFMLGAVIALGLFLAYRTFFGQQEDFYIGGVGDKDEPAVVEFSNESESAPASDGETDTIVIVASNDGVDPQTASSAALTSNREAQVNEEIRVDMKAFENFLLLQDQEWAELLHGLKIMEVQADRYSVEELQQIRQELYDDLERAAQLKKDTKLMDEPGFRELFDYLKPLVKIDTAKC
jgi:serine/threonine protein kinase